MRIPEKTVLGVSGALLILSTAQNLVGLLDGATTAKIHALAAAQTHDSGAFVFGYESGLGLIVLVKLLCGAALLALLLRRTREH
ncbi:MULTISPECIES: hypothetical protein [Oleiagrimonas]|jgi:hypothetical protein|uniref:Uncharacterized protein n=1 Tax=Oleiagrimonas citrea TaxID=1665687 RepID=A0A846ZJS3_9GAMM|nr:MULTISPECIES: hypothetical protein [Oleiagrimonas]NKZ37957.1 hypothetical protein [Oleiagrimonas citrea]RAP57449.1 hypothetical protein BTJ49_10290 [Oleiagrimonas sp. MCCC 1A03011]